MRDNENGLKVALYMRVATGEQTEDARMAMSRQETLLEKLTEDCENIVVGRFWDYASGIRYDRPGLCAAVALTHLESRKSPCCHSKKTTLSRGLTVVQLQL